MHASIAVSLLSLTIGAPRFLDDQFEIPPGFHIYKAADRELTGGSYDIAFDATGRLLIGDGTRIRRLEDRDGDGVFEHSEVLADGLGPRGPQGLIVLGDQVFAVGGDGIQVFDGYRAGGPLTHRGRIGEPFHTGGDHSAHTIFRGHDGYLYFITGDGGGTEDRRHITETSSPALFERSCSVFRVSPDGKRWECVGSGGRNSPNLGMNYLGELFSLDSDMEWHVELPWWRPVRLHHWLSGGDQGWQGVGAYPPYYIDCLPGIYNVGRGSPDWGVFYEHHQLPKKFHDAYLVCDYLSKSATTGGYNTAGRLFAFFLQRRGAGWTSTMEVLARPKPGARDADGQRIDFGLVDIEVGPDGSLFLSDHNQGVWRIFYDGKPASSSTRVPPIAPQWPSLPSDAAARIDALLALPQPVSEWSRVREQTLRDRLGADASRRLQRIAADSRADLRRRLRAIRLIAPDFADLAFPLLDALLEDGHPEIRGQAAWLLGLHGGEEAVTRVVSRLLSDTDPFVRRRAAEALARNPLPVRYLPELITRLGDDDRLVRYAAMTALSHQPPEHWLNDAVAKSNPQIRMRALVAADLRREATPETAARSVVRELLTSIDRSDSSENSLDLLRVLGRFRRALQSDDELTQHIIAYLLSRFGESDKNIRWEAARLLGEYRSTAAFGVLIDALEREDDNVTQFHFAQALARLPEGWTADQERRAVRWFLGRQRGWFAEFAGKGLQFPQFWATVLNEFTRHHRQALLAHLNEIDLASQIGDIALDVLVSSSASGNRLIRLYRAHAQPAIKVRILVALGEVRNDAVAAFLRDEYVTLAEPELRGAALRGLAGQAPNALSRDLLIEGLAHEAVEVVRATADALLRYPLEPGQPLCRLLLTRMGERRELFRTGEALLVHISGTRRVADRGGDRDRRLREADRRAALAFWHAWYQRRFGTEFEPLTTTAVVEKTDPEVHAFLLGGSAGGGDASRGRRVYEAARCATCHGGGTDTKQAAIFGPDLAGVTRRLSRLELADSLVYPSKLIADRFKGVVLQLDTGIPLTGFITEQSDEAITIVNEEGVHRVPRDQVEGMAPQTLSLMPERLLNRLTWDAIRDLYAYLEEVGAQPEKPASR